jgi:hypothetical protein
MSFRLSREAIIKIFNTIAFSAYILGYMID